ncbi:MAG TPA: hypothetical protein VGQ42_12200 [Candidatus Dormibacteraeota bacterium]|jgi:hypothetical protein|nr:hypothetical protein [Candidatus Dormibacteraeota bacterium]
MNPRLRRLLSGLGLLIPGAGFAVLSAYAAMGNGGGCSGTNAAHGVTCATDITGIALVSFPAAIICIILSAGVLRGARWARWPAVIVGALLGTVTAAASVAGITALAGDSSDPNAATVLGVIGLVAALLCALPAVLLPGERGAQAFA